MDDIVVRLRREEKREPHEPIWRDAISEIEQMRATLIWIAGLRTGGMIERKAKEAISHVLPNACGEPGGTNHSGANGA